MNVELINTGSELMLGRVLNTHQQWLSRRLADLGLIVNRQVAVADTAQDIEQTVGEALSRADLVITTGGLGPTSDDLTRDLIARLLDKPLHEDATVLSHIKQFFEIRNRPMPDRTQVQALIPEGALVLSNPHGTAPGLAMEIHPNRFRGDRQPSWLIMLPGPPRELRPMFDQLVTPLLKRVFPGAGAFVCRTLRTSGIGESMVEARIAGLLKRPIAAGLEVGYCARPGQVDVRLAARGPKSRQLVNGAEKIVRRVLRGRLYGEEDEELEAIIVRAVTATKKTLALAESCTGGYIAHRITNVPGASRVLLGAFVTYSNEMKSASLKVRRKTLDKHGAVSEAVAREMAEGAQRTAGADYAISVTGIAGPSGGSAEKPVGTVFIGLAGRFSTIVERNFNPYDRETFKQVTAQQAMDLLRRTLDRKNRGTKRRRS